MQAQTFSISLCNWDEARAEARRIRTLVFVHEQRVPIEIEWDGLDHGCEHALAYAADGSAVATGRLLPDGHIGRMAVLKQWRGQGAGALLLQALVERARHRGHASARLNAQTHASGFYRRFGFEVAGPEFIEAGIAHVPMQRDLRAGGC